MSLESDNILLSGSCEDSLEYASSHYDQDNEDDCEYDDDVFTTIRLKKYMNSPNRVKDHPINISDSREDNDDHDINDGDDTLSQLSTNDSSEDVFLREVNKTKIAFSSYRYAVLHLVQNQPSKRLHDEGHVIEKADTNQRMKHLEEEAMRIVETKAKACFLAVDVAHSWRQRAMDRNQQLDLYRLNVLTELRTQSTMKKPKRSDIQISIAPRALNNMQGDNQIRKKIRTNKEKHCIRHTLPKFNHVDTTEPDPVKKEGEPTPMKYRTSTWIGNLVKWRKRRQQYIQETLGQCGCRDCLNELNTLN
jgi:hypothetical protein